MELVFVRSYLWWAPCVHGASRTEPEVGNSFCGRFALFLRSTPRALYPPVSRRGGSRQAGDGGFFANGVCLEADGEEGEQEEKKRGGGLMGTPLSALGQIYTLLLLLSSSLVRRG